MPIQDHAAQIAATINQIAIQGSRLELPGGTPDRFRVAWALLRLTFDHASSISSNFYQHGPELAGSGFALLRPMNEAFKRGTWFGLCATDKETEAFIREDKLPKGNLAEDIEKIPPFDRFPMFSQQHKNAWDKFHSFTHGGSQIVGAYTMGHGIGAAFPEEDVIKVLNHAEAIAMMAVHVMAMICGEFHPDIAKDVLDELEKVRTAAERKRQS